MIVYSIMLRDEHNMLGKPFMVSFLCCHGWVTPILASLDVVGELGGSVHWSMVSRVLTKVNGYSIVTGLPVPVLALHVTGK